MGVHHVGFEIVSAKNFHLACLAVIILMVQPVNPHVVLGLELLSAQVADLTRPHVVKVDVVLQCSLFGSDESAVGAVEVFLARMSQAYVPSFLGRIVKVYVAVTDLLFETTSADMMCVGCGKLVFQEAAVCAHPPYFTIISFFGMLHQKHFL